MARLLVGAFLLLAPMFAGAATVANLSSGIDGTGAAIPFGTIDDTWTLVSAPVGVAVGPALVVPAARTNYVNLAPNAYWISASAATNIDAPGGLYTYEATFDLTGYTAPSLTGLLSADNRIIDVLLNGAIVFEGPYKGVPCTAQNLNTACVGHESTLALSLLDASLFLPGINVVQIVTENESVTGGNPTAFLINATVTASPVPVPAAAWLFGSAVGVVGLLRRRMTA